MWNFTGNCLKVVLDSNFSRSDGKVDNYKSSGNSRSSKTTNLAVILSQIPRKSQFLHIFPSENQNPSHGLFLCCLDQFISTYLLSVTENILWSFSTTTCQQQHSFAWNLHPPFSCLFWPSFFIIILDYRQAFDPKGIRIRYVWCLSLIKVRSLSSKVEFYFDKIKNK